MMPSLVYFQASHVNAQNLDYSSSLRLIRNKFCSAIADLVSLVD
ncbi:hypothetical protein V2H45_21040 [Tumidithrix elongata RA019]|uniref:Uncharacterized protein n=1 Tax=Tumidithrix elongata BACA0141 TaxID=2716417 RepID=A0AAW9Q8G7_9CYAN|nr:hypothetical protein [Tumidithrix elongata RA019]